MKVLITGGAGFIGHNAAIYLKERGFNVKVYDNLKRQNHATQKRLIQHEVALIKGDILGKSALTEAIRGVDVVVHAAAYINVQESIRKPNKYLRNNALGTSAVAKACIKKDVKRLVYLSSAAVYGNPTELPIVETHPTNPISPYGLSKLLGEEIIKFYSREGLRYATLRLFNVYGLGQSSAYAGVITNFIERASRKLPPIIYGDGEQTRDFIHVDDVSEAILLALEKEVLNETFNIGSGRPTTINELANLVTRISNLNLKPIHVKARRGDIRHSYADIRKAETLLGFKPKISLEKGIKNLIEGWSENAGSSQSFKSQKAP